MAWSAAVSPRSASALAVSAPADTGFLKIHVTGDTAAKCYVRIASPVNWTRIVKADSSKDTTFVFASNTGADTIKIYLFDWYVASTDSVGRGLKGAAFDTVVAPVEGRGSVKAKSALADSVRLNRTAVDTLTCASLSVH